MRQLLLFSIVGFLSVYALASPRIGAFAYVWFALMRPDVMAWSADQYNFSMVLAVCTLVGSLRHLPELSREFSSPITVCFLLLQIPLLLSTVFAVEPTLSHDPYLDYLKSLAVPLLIPVLVNTRRQLESLLLLIALSVGSVGIKFGLYGILHGGIILVGGYGGQMSDNNLLALALAMTVPLCWYGRALTSSRAIRVLLLIILALSVATIPMTNSRGGSLALGIAGLLIVRHSRRRILTAVTVVLLIGAAVSLVYDDYVSRMSTMANYEEEASANSRILHAQAAIRIWEEYPILGVGFGARNYAKLAGRYLGRDNIHVAHNTYLQMLVDSGLLAFLLYVGLLFGSIFWLGRAAKRFSHTDRANEAIGLGLQASLAAFAVGGTFYSSQRYDLPYILLMCAATWQILLRQTARESVPESPMRQQLLEVA